MRNRHDLSPATRPARFRRILAVVFAILHVGLGHPVLGYTRRGFTWIAGALLVIAGMVLGVLVGPRQIWWLGVATGIAIQLAAIVDTLRLPAPLVPPRTLRTVLISVAMVAVLQLGVFTSTRLARGYRLPTPSMSPTLETGDYVMTSHIRDNLERGDIIAFDHPLDPGTVLIKRIVGLAGDDVEVRDGRLILNGTPVDAKPTDARCPADAACSILHETLDGKTHTVVLFGRPDSQTFGPERVPQGHLFVMGDNRDNSADSRHWGTVPVTLVLGKPKFIYWSSGDSGIRWNRINQVVQ